MTWPLIEQQDLVTGCMVKSHRGLPENRPRNPSPVAAVTARLSGPPPSFPPPPGISRSAGGVLLCPLHSVVGRILISISPRTETTLTAQSTLGAEMEERGWGLRLSSNGDPRRRPPGRAAGAGSGGLQVWCLHTVGARRCFTEMFLFYSNEGHAFGFKENDSFLFLKPQKRSDDATII